MSEQRNTKFLASATKKLDEILPVIMEGGHKRANELLARYAYDIALQAVFETSQGMDRSLPSVKERVNEVPDLPPDRWEKYEKEMRGK